MHTEKNISLDPSQLVNFIVVASNHLSFLLPQSCWSPREGYAWHFALALWEKRSQSAVFTVLAGGDENEKRVGRNSASDVIWLLWGSTVMGVPP